MTTASIQLARGERGKDQIGMTREFVIDARRWGSRARDIGRAKVFNSFRRKARVIARQPSVEKRKSSSEAGVGCVHLISKRLSRLKRTLAANTRVINYCYASVLRSPHRALNGNN